MYPAWSVGYILDAVSQLSSLSHSSTYQYMINNITLQNQNVLVTLKLNLQSKQRSAKSLSPDTFKETGSTFRGISIIWMVNWAVNKLERHEKMLHPERLLSILRNNITCHVLSYVMHFDVTHIHKGCKAENWQHR